MFLYNISGIISILKIWKNIIVNRAKTSRFRYKIINIRDNIQLNAAQVSDLVNLEHVMLLLFCYSFSASRKSSNNSLFLITAGPPKVANYALTRAVNLVSQLEKLLFDFKKLGTNGKNFLCTFPGKEKFRLFRAI